jgi:type VI secretion system protein ImpJ
MAVSPFHWGVQFLKVDQVLLIDGVLRVLALEAVMPDGLVVSYQREDDFPIEVDLAPYQEAMKQAPQMVFLSVPAKKTAGPGIRGALERFDSVESAPVADENTGEAEIRMPVLRPRLSLLVGETPPKKYNAFPLLEVAYRNETYTVTEYMPPTLRVPVNSVLGEMCSAVARRLREKAIFLSDQVRSNSAGQKGAVVLETKALIQCLVAGLPGFEGVLGAGVAHPYLLYLSFCQLVGQMAGVGLSLVPPVLAAYDHNDLRTSFLQVRDYVFRMIEEGILESHTPVVFSFKKNLFGLRIQPEWMAGDLIVGARARPGTADAEVVAWFESSLIGSNTRIESMKDKRVLGPERERVDADGALVPPRGMVLFSVKADKAFIEPGKTLLVFNPSDPGHQRGPSELILYVRNQPSSDKDRK